MTGDGVNDILTLKTDCSIGWNLETMRQKMAQWSYWILTLGRCTVVAEGHVNWSIIQR